jgi:hypothetical protein
VAHETSGATQPVPLELEALELALLEALELALLEALELVLLEALELALLEALELALLEALELALLEALELALLELALLELALLELALLAPALLEVLVEDADPACAELLDPPAPPASITWPPHAVAAPKPDPTNSPTRAHRAPRLPPASAIMGPAYAIGARSRSHDELAPHQGWLSTALPPRPCAAPRTSPSRPRRNRAGPGAGPSPR